MEDKVLESGKIGSIGSQSLGWKSGGLEFEVDAAEKFATLGVKVRIDGGQLCDFLASVIPGTVDDAVFALIKAALIAAK